jgi:hypothetical protein
MTRALWTEGRLSWGVVAVVVFMTVSVLAFDLAWRFVTIQFDTLLIYAIVVDAAVAVALALVIRLLWRRPRRV